jgi:hypothetical protein
MQCINIYIGRPQLNCRWKCNRVCTTPKLFHCSRNRIKCATKLFFPPIVTLCFRIVTPWGIETKQKCKKKCNKNAHHRGSAAAVAQLSTWAPPASVSCHHGGRGHGQMVVEGPPASPSMGARGRRRRHCAPQMWRRSSTKRGTPQEFTSVDEARCLHARGGHRQWGDGAAAATAAVDGAPVDRRLVKMDLRREKTIGEMRGKVWDLFTNDRLWRLGYQWRDFWSTASCLAFIQSWSFCI